jgi:hypothetical protein
MVFLHKSGLGAIRQWHVHTLSTQIKEKCMILTFRYHRDDLITDVQLQGAPYRVLRRLRDEDTGVALYVVQRVDDTATQWEADR